MSQKGVNNNFYGKRHSLESIEKMKNSKSGENNGMFGKKISEDTRLKLSIARKKYFSDKANRLKLSNILKSKKETLHLWKGGITNKNLAVRKSLEYRTWRESIFKRDDWTCVLCKVRGVKLEADHIKKFSNYPELRFDINNGRTLCIPCHKMTDTYGNKNP